MVELVCNNPACSGRGPMRVRRAGPERWEVVCQQSAGEYYWEEVFFESGVAPCCPFCGGPLLWPSELYEGVEPTTPDEAERLARWIDALDALF